MPEQQDLVRLGGTFGILDAGHDPMRNQYMPGASMAESASDTARTAAASGELSGDGGRSDGMTAAGGAVSSSHGLGRRRGHGARRPADWPSSPNVTGSIVHMLDLLRDLVAHKGHANATLLRAIAQNRAAASDPELWELLHHVLLANRFWLLAVTGQPFVHDDEARVSSSFDALVQRYASTQAAETAWLATATETDLTLTPGDARIPGGRCSVAQAFVQVCLHSHGHRAQAAKMLRRHGGVPPPSDFILWLATRPRPQWLEVR